MQIPKRASNVNRKARRKRSWERGQQRKAARRGAQVTRQERNRDLRMHDMMTPWDRARSKRSAARAPLRDAA